jgi:hypothetical protein
VALLIPLGNAAVAVALLAIVAAAGRRVRRVCRWPLPPALRLPVDVSLGAFALSAAVMVVGLAGWFHAAALGAITLLLGGAGVWRGQRWRWLPLLPPALAASPLLVVALAAPFFYDALIYHLGLPWQALLEGRWTAAPQALYGASPALAQLVAAVPLACGAMRAPALLHWATFVLAGGAVYAAARGLGAARPLAGLAAGAFPVLAAYRLVPGFPAAEGWGALAIVAAFAVALLPAMSPGGAVLAGLLAGIATGARVQVLPLVLLLGVVLAVRERWRWRPLGAAALGWALGSIPWWLKNLVLLGEPFAPLGWRREGMEAVWRDAVSTMFTAHRLGDLLHPYTAVLWPHLLYLGPLLVAGAVAVASAPARRRARLLAVAFLGGLAAWGLTGAIPRYLAPVLALVLVLAALPVRRAGRVLSAAALFVALAWGIAVNLRDVRWLGGAALVTASRGAVWAHLVVNDPLPAFEGADALPRDARVLFVGESRGFLFPRRFLAPSYYDLSPLRGPLETLPTSEAVIAWLRAAGFTHLLVNWGELRRLAPDYPAEPWRTETGRRRFGGLIATLRPAVVSAGGVEIFALPQPPRGGAAPPPRV